MTGADFVLQGNRRHIIQGEFGVGIGDNGSITTILGSCISACLYDSVGGFGGMNHFLLPDGNGHCGQAASFGVNAMELLINRLIKQGAVSSRFQAKIFGGARMITGLSDVGARNAEFIIGFLQKEGINCIAQSLGGTQARRVEFWPESGRARQRFLSDAPVVETAPKLLVANDVEIF